MLVLQVEGEWVRDLGQRLFYSGQIAQWFRSLAAEPELGKNIVMQKSVSETAYRSLQSNIFPLKPSQCDCKNDRKKIVTMRIRR